MTAIINEMVTRDGSDISRRIQGLAGQIFGFGHSRVRIFSIHPEIKKYPARKKEDNPLHGSGPSLLVTLERGWGGG